MFDRNRSRIFVKVGHETTQYVTSENKISYFH